MTSSDEETTDTGCRCAEDGGTWCYERARRESELVGPAEVEMIDWLWRSRAASGVPFHIIDEAVLRKIADIMARPFRNRE